MRKVIKRVLAVIGIVTAVLIAGCILFVAVGKAVNYQKTKIKSPEGIQENVLLDINGIEQELNIRGENQDNPVIVFLHGGPGSPVGYLNYIWEPYLNDQFTIITYDQRGCGRTYYANRDAEVSRELILQDVDAVVDYARERFGKEKVVIMGHSWGTLLGTLYIQEHADKVSAYVGVGQVVSTHAGEEIAVSEAVKRAAAANDTAYVEQMTAAYEAFCKSYQIDSNFVTYRGMFPKYLLGEREKTTMQLAPSAVTSPDMNLEDAKWFLFDSSTVLLDKGNTLTADLFDFDANEMTDYKVPMYFISGGNDYVTPFSAVEAYCEKIEAPKKDIVIIDGAGHNTFADVPQEFADAVRQFNLEEEQ